MIHRTLTQILYHDWKLALLVFVVLPPGGWAIGRLGKRMRKVGIVAVARKLLVALWRYLETGEIPAGAQLKS